MVDLLVLRNVRPFSVVIHHTHAMDKKVSVAIEELETKSQFVTCWQSTTAYLSNAEKYEQLRTKRPDTASSRISVDSLIAQANRKEASKGLEINPEAGNLANSILRTWTACKEYQLVGDYVDNAKYNSLITTVDGMRKSVDLKMCREGVAKCATKLPDNYYDVIMYVEPTSRANIIPTLTAYWSKLKTGGMLIGMDISDVRHGKMFTKTPPPKPAPKAKSADNAKNKDAVAVQVTAAQMAAQFFAQAGSNTTHKISTVPTPSMINIWYVVK